MQRRALSPLGLKRQRIGRKAMSSARMLHGIEKKLGPEKDTSAPQKKRRISLPHYHFRRWHAFALLAVIAVGILGSFGYGQYQQAQAKEQQKQAAVKQQAAVKESNKRQTCYKKVVTEKAAQVGKLTYDQLYGGACD